MAIINGLENIFDWSPLGLVINNFGKIKTWMASFSLSTEGGGVVAGLIEGFRQWSLLAWFKEQFTLVLNYVTSIASQIAAKIKNAFSYDIVKSGLTAMIPAWAGGAPAAPANMPVQKFATGGLLTGPGTGTSDDIPFWGSNGEFIVNAAATAKNLPWLKAMNNGSFGKVMKMTMAAAAVSMPVMMPSLATASPKYMSPPIASKGKLADGSQSSSQANRVEINYSPTITITGGGSDMEAKFKQMLKQQAHDITKMVEAQQKRNNRKKH